MKTGLEVLKIVLLSYCFQDVWTQGRVENVTAFLVTFKGRMLERFKLELNTKISGSDRFKTYRSFKSEKRLENYLNAITTKKLREFGDGVAH